MSDNPAVAVVGLCVSIFASSLSIIAFRTARADKYKDELLAKKRAAIEFARSVMSVDFRTKVTAVAWQGILKWLYWENETSRILYKRDVCWAFLGWQERYRRYNPARRELHQMDTTSSGDPHDQFAKIEPGKLGISEHEALTILLETWAQIAIMMRNGLADQASAVDLLSTQYGYILSFITELLDTFYYAGEKLGIELPGWTGNLSRLEVIFSSDKEFERSLRRAKERLTESSYLQQREEVVSALQRARACPETEPARPEVAALPAAQAV